MTRTLPAAGMLALPLAIAASLLSLVVGAAHPDAPQGRVELEVVGLLPMTEGSSSILVLREKGGAKTLVPLLVPGAAARDLKRTLAARERKGMTEQGGVLGEAIAKLGGRVREVEISEAEETPGAAHIRLAQGARQLELLARPSESVALAVSAGAPILTTRKVVDESGLTPADLEKARDRMGLDRARGLKL